MSENRQSVRRRDENDSPTASLRESEHFPAVVLLGITAVFLLACWGAVYVNDVFGLTDFAPERGLWYHLFRNRGPVEWMQWIYMSITFLLSAYLAGAASERGRTRDRIFWLLIAAGFTLMLIEDAGDVRLIFAHYGRELFGWQRHYIEMLYFLFTASPLLIAWLKYRKTVTTMPTLLPYIYTGTFLYAAAAGASALREFRSFYYVIGDFLSVVLTAETIQGFFLVDFMMEETVELMAAALLCSSVILYQTKTGLGSSGKEPDSLE